MKGLSGDRRAAKAYRLGSHRICGPEDTWRRIQPLLPLFGITRVADVTALDRLGIPVFQAIRPLSRNISVSQGKAPTAMGARVSAAMEAIELWHAEDLSALPQVELSVREMRSASCLNLEELPWLPRAIRLEGWSFPWIEATSLASAETTWLPRSMIELDFTVQPRLEPRLFHRTSNGLASGNCREEALVHALCEVIERHALHLVATGARQNRSMDTSTVGCPACRDLIARIRGAGAQLAIHDLTWKIDIPVITADLYLSDLPQVFSGSGCHPSPEVALSRALTEAVQSRLTVISGARDDLDLPPPGDNDAAIWASEPPNEILGGLGTSSSGTPSSGTPSSGTPSSGTPSSGTLADVSSDDLAQDLELLVRRLTDLGHEPFVVYLTRQDIGIPVVRVFAPGLGEAHG